jgi:DNA repair protein RecO (recombination protein O)
MVEEPETRGFREHHVMLRRTEGIVLRTFPFGEADLIVTFLTPDFGLIKVFAKSPRKIKSRFGSSLEPLTCSRVSFWGKEDAALPRLTQSDIMHSFQTIRNNLHVFLKVSEIMELTVTLVPEKDINEKIYTLLYNTLSAIEHNIAGCSGNSFSRKGSGEDLQGEQKIHHSIDFLVSHYKVKFLKYAGFAPKLDACGRCGEEGFCFYVSQGSVLCESCAKGIGTPIEISAAMRKLYEDLLLWDTEKVQRIKPSQILLASLSEVMSMHIKYILAKSLKTEAFVYAGGKI